VPSSEIPKVDQGLSSASLSAQGEAVTPTVALDESLRSQRPTQTSMRSDKVEYERLLGLFGDGDLDGARQGFAVFLRDYGDSDLAPNARYWLGESYYSKKDYPQAIDSYDRVELDFPRSEKAPAAILKKGYAYLAMNDKKRASLAFSQVLASYPRTPEAGKASGKLSQLRESR
jgi:tol-pal system protein YbgF